MNNMASMKRIMAPGEVSANSMPALSSLLRGWTPCNPLHPSSFLATKFSRYPQYIAILVIFCDGPYYDQMCGSDQLRNHTHFRLKCAVAEVQAGATTAVAGQLLPAAQLPLEPG